MTILVAGATGNFGGRIVHALLERGATVRALVRAGTDQPKLDKLKDKGAEIVSVDMTDSGQLTVACNNVDCVVSALQGLHDVIVNTQSRLLDAAIAAGVPRFIPSDFSTDFTQLPGGENRNFDLRREFMEYIDSTSIRATSVMNGAFADLLSRDMPLLDFSKKQAGYWDDEHQKADFTTMDDVAAFTADAALDVGTPRILRIASFQISPAELAKAASEVTGHTFTLTNMGRLADLAAYNRRGRAADPDGENQLYPRWQQGQYMQSMFSVLNDPLDNSRYPDIQWTSVKDVLKKRV
ncbi:aromatic alcohol reductase [Spirosoma rhododendri]|uniref:Aromatic alcohol reductase n=1 Tax=Spirosoma rhododendri TaxID=2728024 RepID=A0A7L5DGF1_9BACT|nr:aromatic alcohol reductase [Spirosoma rhododendri]QJD76985.1 aromatic alcohol reductase [Spirosoma rhododendri]